MNTVLGGVILIVYVFVMITCYVFISGPFSDIVTSFDNINLSESDAQVAESSSTARTVFDMVFAGLVIAPIIWFIYLVFYREPDWRYRA